MAMIDVISKYPTTHCRGTKQPKERPQEHIGESVDQGSKLVMEVCCRQPQYNTDADQHFQDAEDQPAYLAGLAAGNLTSLPAPR
jgi:hypothetical protein